MAGILDSKTRILDSVVTEIGRSQISSGLLKIEYVSLTDSMTYYEADAVTGHDNANTRIYFESPGNKENDFITFETDDSGNLMGFPIDSSVTIVGDELFKSDLTSSAVNSSKFVKKSGNFASISRGIVTSSIDHFKKNYMIGSLSGNEKLGREFILNKTDLTFTIDNSFPFENGPENAISDIDSIEPLFMDKRLSHIPNFKFLPPLVVYPKGNVFNRRKMKKREKSGKEQVFLGDYVPINEQQTEMTYSDLMRHLNGKYSFGIDPDNLDARAEDEEPWGSSGKSAGRSIKKSPDQEPDASIMLNTEREIIRFLETSEQNNLVMQLFEVDDRRLKFKKLDVIDFGEIINDNDSRPNKHIFFAGKVYLDAFNVPTFVNIFTIILD
tara:strand:+ start:999 stop:2147 length:1149 start_codon:yes stop_codon:yes gene_type:complete